MLLQLPKDHAIISIRLAITELLRVNKVIMAHELVHCLKPHIRNRDDIRGVLLLYPSWYRRGDLCPPSRRAAAQTDLDDPRALADITRHLLMAYFYFEEAGMHEAMRACIEFGVRHNLEGIGERIVGTV